MSKELYEATIHDLNDRKRWEDRQAVFYEMRHAGLRRKFKPWPGAADLHYPLADSMIEKHKPFYYQLLFVSDLIASFTALKQQSQELSMGAAEWFSFKIKQKTNLETEILTLIDFMLMAGSSVMKIYWDSEKKRVAFCAVDPIYFAISPLATCLEDATHYVHIMHFSEDAYKQIKQFNQDEVLIERIKGNGVDSPVKEDLKFIREGITKGQNDNQIIVWEDYKKGVDGILMNWYSPLLPSEPLRPEMKMPYNHGNDPFVHFQSEIKDKGFYSSRGIPEIVAPIEAQLCKLMNEKSDAMTLVNRPIYSSSGQAINAQNIRLTPGQIIPFPITAVMQPPPPMSFEQEEINLRMIAEYRVGMPDFGVGQQINTDQRRTATEISQISNQAGQGMDLRGRIFRKALGKLFQQAWALYMQFDKASLTYFLNDEMKSLDNSALHGEYAIEPTGSTDNVNKPFLLNKAVARFQMFNGDPNIDQPELRKTVLEADDPRLVKRLLVLPPEKISEQGEEQADEINNMLIGYPVQISKLDDHVVHLQTLVQFVLSKMQKGEQVQPDAAVLLLKHGSEHQAAIQAGPNSKKILQQIDQGQMGVAIGYLTSIVQGAAQATSIAMLSTSTSADTSADTSTDATAW